MVDLIRNFEDTDNNRKVLSDRMKAIADLLETHPNRVVDDSLVFIQEGMQATRQAAMQMGYAPEKADNEVCQYDFGYYWADSLSDVFLDGMVSEHDLAIAEWLETVCHVSLDK